MSAASDRTSSARSLEGRPIGFDDELLIELGFAAMPPADRQELIRSLQEELELRVGTELSARLDEGEVEEFERISGGDVAAARRWLRAHRHLEEDEPDFVEEESGMEGPTAPLVTEWVSSLWLKDRLPDFRAVARRTFSQILSELEAYRDELLSTDR